MRCFARGPYRCRKHKDVIKINANRVQPESEGRRLKLQAGDLSITAVENAGPEYSAISKSKVFQHPPKAKYSPDERLTPKVNNETMLGVIGADELTAGRVDTRLFHSRKDTVCRFPATIELLLLRPRDLLRSRLPATCRRILLGHTPLPGASGMHVI